VVVRARDCQQRVADVPAPVLELLRLELQSDGVGLAATARALGPALWVEQGCERGQPLVLVYVDAQEARRVERSISLGDVPNALRDRTLALALAELFRAGTAQRAPQPTAASVATPTQEVQASSEPEPAAKPEAAEQPGPAEQPARTPAAVRGTAAPAPERPGSSSSAALGWAIALGPALQVLPTSGSVLFGAEVACSWRSLSAGVLGSLGSSNDSLGSVAYRRLHGFVAYDLLHTDPARLRLSGGVRAAIGATFASVTPAAAALSSDVVAPSGDLALEATLALLLSAHWLAKLRLDFGYALGPRFRAETRELADFSGVFVGASLCASASLP
jgi:hypothetical protein